ncbi:Uncharacterized protein FKW44_001691, partial [Caligus rogercresseyi]
SHETDLSIAVQLLDCAIADLSAYREHFEESKQAAQGLSENKAFENTRARKVKAHFDELSQDERLADADSYFRVHVFNACLDIVISQLTQRFTGLRSTAERFKAIQPMTLCTATDDELFRQASKLVDIYRDDITEDFPIQLLSFRACLKQRISQVKTVRELAKMLLIENSCITASFGEVCTVLMLFLTIPVTVASAERSFSKLKLIKSYLRSSMGQSRLSGLAILSIENARARQLDVQDLIEEFAQSKAGSCIYD